MSTEQQRQRPHHRVRVWHRPMRARDTAEPHRAATPLELLFDLCFVVAVAQAAIGLHHDIAENHVGEGVLSFLLVFFAIWWAWMNFTWFASAFDTDDGPYRLTTFVQIAGSLVVAAGIPRAFDDDFRVVVAGYVVMRLAMVTQWLRAARSDVDCRPASLRYAAGIVVAQVAWVLWLFLPASWVLPAFAVFVLIELATPVWAERAHGTNYHRHHIAERYGLFTIIVLGETILGSTNTFREAIAEGHLADLVSLAVAALVIVFSLWWLYFDQPGHVRLGTLRASITWGYGHYVIFASLAALGAGIEVAVDYDTHTAHIGGVTTALATTIPVALFLLSVWLLHVGPSNECRPIAIGFPVAAVLVLAATFTPAPIHFAAGICALLVLTAVLATRGHPVDQ